MYIEWGLTFASGRLESIRDCKADSNAISKNVRFGRIRDISFADVKKFLNGDKRPLGDEKRPTAHLRCRFLLRQKVWLPYQFHN